MTEAAAFVPGHITAFFSAHPHDDPTKTGSRGAGLALTDGVSVTVTPAEQTRITLDGEPIAMAPVETVLETLAITAQVTAESDLPLGAGFGVSGAMTLGTALAANAVFDRRLSRNELVTIAHGAEVQAGTGLGDVVAQAEGGVPIRLEPGGPHENAMDAIPARRQIEYVSFGDLSTSEVLAGDTEALTAAGQAALSRVVQEPTLSTVLRAGRRFTREADLLTESVAEALTAVADAGGDGSMAMLGETVYAVGTGLSEAGYEPSVCAIDPCGARLEPVE